MSKLDSCFVISTARVVAAVAICCCCHLLAPVAAQDGATGVGAATAGAELQSLGAKGQFVQPDENILTDKGEVVVDEKSGARLPEDLNDGELEGGDHHTEWNYHDQTKWAGEYPGCEGANLRQSPIDIETDKVLFNTRMKLEFIDYDQEVEFECKNTHHSVSMVPIASIAPPTLRVNWVQGSDLYELQEIHFHWGDGINKGSEHEVNNERAAAEMHMVHYRKGLDKAKMGSEENSVLVIGVFIESDAVEHNKLEGLVARVGHVNGTDAQYKDNNPENLINLLPENHHSFYTYNGSLTTPPCYEVVTWILMSEPVYMCQDKLTELSNLEAQIPGVGRRKIAANHRDIQPLLDRPVYASFNTTESSSLNRGSIGKRIGRNGTLAHALNEYWRRVNRIRVSVKRAYKSIRQARKRLLKKLGLKKDDHVAEAARTETAEHPPPDDDEANEIA